MWEGDEESLGTRLRDGGLWGDLRRTRSRELHRMRTESALSVLSLILPQKEPRCPLPNRRVLEQCA